MDNTERLEWLEQIGEDTSKGVALMRFTNEDSRVSLVTLPYIYFPEFVFIQNHDYERGEVVRIGSNKYLFPDGGRIDHGQTPATSNRCLLHRDRSSYEPDGARRQWVREEFCLQGWLRYWTNASRPQENGWYRVRVRRVMDSTNPAGASDRWEFMGLGDPPN